MNIKIRDLDKKKFIGTFILFCILYFNLDYLNMKYSEMALKHGYWLVILNVFLNILMATMSSFMIVLSDYVLKVKGIKTMGDNMSFASILFGILTYSCTPCVISFLAVLGISFSVAALPFGGLPYKFVSLLLILVGIFILLRELKRKSCKMGF